MLKRAAQNVHLKTFGLLTVSEVRAGLAARSRSTAAVNSSNEDGAQFSTTRLIEKETFLEGRVLKIKFNDPATSNALSLNLLEELKGVLLSSHKNSLVRALVLSGKPNFASGHDLHELTREAGPGSHAKVFTTCTSVLKLIQDIDIPVIAEVHGMAVASGCRLAATCDIVVASENAQFAAPGVSRGLFCNTTGIALARNVPKHFALDMLFTGNFISATEAYQMGLVSRLVAEDDVETETLKVCEAICASSRPIVALGKNAFHAQTDLKREAAYTEAEKVMRRNLRHKDAQEGIEATLSARQPQWSHEPEKAH